MGSVDEFNWVKERGKCSPSLAFERLRGEVRQDVEDRNAIRGPIPSHAYLFQSDSSTSFTVILSGNQLHSSVRFLLSGEVISVEIHEQRLDATLTLQDTGECVFKLGREEVGFWQFRKRALEKLFFIDAQPNPVSE
jgi:hypothetical protein